MAQCLMMSILHCSHMPLRWPTPVVWPSFGLLDLWPWINQLATLSLASKSFRLRRTDSTQILIRSSTVSEWRDALVQWFSNPPFKTIKNLAPPSQLKLPNHFTKHYETKQKSIYRKKPVPFLSNYLSVLILYFNAAKFSIKLFYIIYLTVFCQSTR